MSASAASSAAAATAAKTTKVDVFVLRYSEHARVALISSNGQMFLFLNSKKLAASQKDVGSTCVGSPDFNTCIQGSKNVVVDEVAASRLVVQLVETAIRGKPYEGRKPIRFAIRLGDLHQSEKDGKPCKVITCQLLTVKLKIKGKDCLIAILSTGGDILPGADFECEFHSEEQTKNCPDEFKPFIAADGKVKGVVYPGSAASAAVVAKAPAAAAADAKVPDVKAPAAVAVKAGDKRKAPVDEEEPAARKKPTPATMPPHSLPAPPQETVVASATASATAAVPVPAPVESASAPTPESVAMSIPAVEKAKTIAEKLEGRMKTTSLSSENRELKVALAKAKKDLAGLTTITEAKFALDANYSASLAEAIAERDSARTALEEFKKERDSLITALGLAIKKGREGSAECDTAIAERDAAYKGFAESKRELQDLVIKLHDLKNLHAFDLKKSDRFNAECDAAIAERDSARAEVLSLKTSRAEKEEAQDNLDVEKIKVKNLEDALARSKADVVSLTAKNAALEDKLKVAAVVPENTAAFQVLVAGNAAAHKKAAADQEAAMKQVQAFRDAIANLLLLQDSLRSSMLKTQHDLEAYTRQIKPTTAAAASTASAAPIKPMDAAPASASASGSAVTATAVRASKPPTSAWLPAVTPSAAASEQTAYAPFPGSK